MSPDPPQAKALLRVQVTTLVASVVAALCSGTLYAYSAYAPQLGARLGLSQTQLNVIGATLTLGVHGTGPIWGPIIDTRGPHVCFAFAFVVYLGGFWGVRYIYNHGVPDSPDTVATLVFLFLIFLNFMHGAACHGGVNGSLNATAKVFPGNARGTTTALVMAGAGASTFVFLTISRTLSVGDTSALLLLFSIGTSVPMAIAFFLVPRVSSPPVVSTILERRTDDEQDPLLSHDHNRNFGWVVNWTAIRYFVTFPTGVHFPVDCLPVMAGIQVTFPVVTFFARLIFGYCTFYYPSKLAVAGTGLMYINNVGTIAQVLYIKGTPVYDPIEAAKWQADQVALISLMNCLGRFSIGVFSDFLTNYCALPRSYTFTLVSFLFLTSQLVAASMVQVQNLWTASAMVGFAYGTVYGVFPAVCVEQFGIACFSESWGYILTSPIIGAGVLSLAFGRNFDSHVPRSFRESLTTLQPATLFPKPSIFARADDLPIRCRDGRDCYVASFYLTSGLCFSAIVLSVWIGWRERRKRVS